MSLNEDLHDQEANRFERISKVPPSSSDGSSIGESHLSSVSGCGLARVAARGYERINRSTSLSSNRDDF